LWVRAASGVASAAQSIALIATPVVLIGAAIWRFRRRSAWAAVYLVSFPGFLSALGLVGWERWREGVMTQDTLIALQAAAAVHMIAVSSALALRLQRQRAKEERVRSHYTERLARQVEARTAELASASRHLQATNAQKDRLFSIIAHDLRGPLNAIVAAADSMARQPEAFTQAETARFAADMRDAGLGLRETLENLLGWARIQTNRLQLRRQPVDAAALVVEIERLFRAVARARSVLLECEAEPNLRFESDYEAVKTILRNFVSNALKATPAGGRVLIYARSGFSRQALLGVRDDGPGMDAEVRAGLFRLRGAEVASGTEERGAGIGLVLCAELAEKLEAEIDVQSAVGKGSTFELRLRLR
jgi:signal transduction histidine kinase